jgi:hypothetical protein
VADDEPAAARVVLFFASTRTAAIPRCYWRTKVLARTLCISHVEDWEN